MDDIPEYVSRSVPKETFAPPFSEDMDIDTLLNREHKAALRLADDLHYQHKEEYDQTYLRLQKEFLEALSSKEDIAITLIRVHDTPISRSSRRKAIPTTYQLLAINKFAQQLAKKKYEVTHGEVVNYRTNPDLNAHFDYCDSYYMVGIKIK